MDFLSACKKFVAIDSSPNAGTAELARYALELANSLGLHAELQEESLAGLGQANVIVRPQAGRPAQEFLLQTHLDTVDPGNFGLWGKTGANPFHASIYQDAIYGLGAADVKLDFLCKLRAMYEMREQAWKIPPVLVGTYGEELGMGGALKLIRKKKVAAKMALIGEPTEFRLITAGKGLATVEIEIPFSEEERRFKQNHDIEESASTQSRIFLGRAAHSSSPDMGESAIEKMLDYLEKLPESIALMEIEGGIAFNTVPAHAVLEFAMVGDLRNTVSSRIRKVVAATQAVAREFQRFADPQFVPGTPTLNIGMVRCFEESVKFTGCCRLTPAVTQEIYEGWMGTLRRACEEVGAIFRITDYKPPFRTPSNSTLVAACQSQLRDMARPDECMAQAVTNEAHVFSRLGIECVVLGPGRGVGNSHTPDEHVKIQDLQDATQMYRGILQRVCL